MNQFGMASQVPVKRLPVALGASGLLLGLGLLWSDRNPPDQHLLADADSVDAVPVWCVEGCDVNIDSLTLNIDTLLVDNEEVLQRLDSVIKLVQMTDSVVTVIDTTVVSPGGGTGQIEYLCLVTTVYAWYDSSNRQFYWWPRFATAELGIHSRSFLDPQYVEILTQVGQYSIDVNNAVRFANDASGLTAQPIDPDIVELTRFQPGHLFSHTCGSQPYQPPADSTDWIVVRREGG